MIREISNMVVKWYAVNRDHHIARKLDDRILRDIGLTRLEVDYPEAATPLRNWISH